MRLILFTPPTTLLHEHATLKQLAARAAAAAGDASPSSPPLPLPAALHVRKPGADEASVEEYLRRLPRVLLERAVLHSHHGLADKFGIKGIHFTEAARKALPGETGRHPRGRNQRGVVSTVEGAARGRESTAALTLSTSLHSCAEVVAETEAKKRGCGDNDDAETLPYDYVFLSPLFESISKPGYGGRRGKVDFGASPSLSSQFWDEELEDDDGIKDASALKPSRRLTEALSSARASGLGVVALGGIDASNVRVVRDIGLFEAAAVLGAVWGREDDAVEAWEELVVAAASP